MQITFKRKPITKKYQDTNAVARFANQEFFKTVLKLTQCLEYSTILDVGCREGIPLSLLIRQNSTSRAAGIDLNSDRVRIARQKIPSADFLISNAQSLPIRAQAFDLLVSLETLEHVGYPDRALQEYARLSRRYILLSVPNEPWWRIGNMMRLKYVRDFGNTPGHINHWTRLGFCDLVGKYFRILKVATPFLWTFVLSEKKINNCYLLTLRTQQ